uniref:Uncharacterized protein n=1 Tax=Avena sativa TaxID=4498 RepID=A0ACD5U4Q5_AVESA
MATSHLLAAAAATSSSSATFRPPLRFLSSPPSSLTLNRRRSFPVVCAADADAKETTKKPTIPDKAPAAGSSFNQLLGIKGAKQETAGHDFPIIFYLALGGSLLSYIYSAPPLKLKQNGWIGNFALGASYIGLPWDQRKLMLIQQSILKLRSSELILILKLHFSAYLLSTGKLYYALALLGLTIPQVILQFQYFLKDPVKYDVKYQASAQPFFVFGLLVTALATSH